MTTEGFVIKDNVEGFNGDLLVFCVLQAKEGGICHGPVEKQVQKAVDLGDFSGKEEETLLFYPLDGMDRNAGASRVLVLGLGDPSKQEEPGGVRDLFRRAGGAIAKQCEKLKALTLMVKLPETEFLEPGQMAECLVEGICLGDYRFVKYKKEKSKEREYPGLNQVALVPGKADHGIVKRGIDLGRTAAMAVCKARDMANEPGNAWTAGAFAEFAGNLAESHSLGCRILDKDDMERLGMGGILAVNRGSDEPPKMVVVEYLPENRSETILLVGKGVTFDSGGISLKTAAGMEQMKYDMCGGAAVLCAMQVVALERPNVGVVAVIPTTDNLAGGMAVKPGDVIRHFDGTTSEIINTDAEGRMILADAIAWGLSEYNPCCVVDIATLTGAVVMGLGHHYSGLMGNNDLLAGRLVSAGARSGEPLWRLPLGKAYSKQIESKVADIRNIGGKSAGAITAAAYLENFVGDTPWAHLDIAGTAWDFTEKTYIPKGPSGVGVRTLVELIRSWEPGVWD